MLELLTTTWTCHRTTAAACVSVFFLTIRPTATLSPFSSPLMKRNLWANSCGPIQSAAALTWHTVCLLLLVIQHFKSPHLLPSSKLWICVLQGHHRHIGLSLQRATRSDPTTQILLDSHTIYSTCVRWFFDLIDFTFYLGPKWNAFHYAKYAKVSSKYTHSRIAHKLIHAHHLST